MTQSLRSSTPTQFRTSLLASRVFGVGRMRRAYSSLSRDHRRTAGNLGGNPVLSNILGGIEVSMVNVPAVDADKALTGAVLSRNVLAPVALLRGVVGVHEHDGDAVLGSFVRQHLLLTTKRPRVHSAPGTTVEPPTPHANVREVFQY